MGWRDYQFPSLSDKEDKEDKVILAEATSSSSSSLSPCTGCEKLPAVVEDQESNFSWWLKRIKHAVRIDAIFSILEQFQQLHWTDHQRSQMAHAYHGRLRMLGVMNTKIGGGRLDSACFSAFQVRVSSSQTIDDLASTLRDFSQGDLSVLELAAMSNLYTPVALKLIENHGAHKAQTLEFLAALCWGEV